VLIPLALALSYGYFDGGGADGNQNSRLGLVYAVVDEGRLAIDSYHDTPGTWTIDKSLHQGHYYSEKALGTAVLGVAAYAPIRALRAARPALGGILGRVTRHWITLVAVGLPIAAALGYLFIVLERVGLERRLAAGIALLTGLATPVWPFATVYFGHALAAASLTAAFAMVLDRRHARRPWTAGARVGLGALLGFSTIAEFPAAPAAAVLALYYLFDARERGDTGLARTWLLPAAGGLALPALQLAYNAACFASPFSLGYGNLAEPQFRVYHAYGFLGIGVPDLRVLYYLTVHPVRGIFAQSPILAAGLVGLCLAVRRRRWRPEAIVCLLVFAIALFTNAGFSAWWGGFSFTARHLVAAMPFLMVGLAFVPRRTWPLVAALAVVSAAQMLIAVVGGPLTSDVELRQMLDVSLGAVAAHGSPIWTQIWPGLFADPPRLSASVARLLGLHGLGEVVPYLLAMSALFLIAAARDGRRGHVVSRSPSRRAAGWAVEEEGRAGGGAPGGG
jgi:hypothetical protein